MGANSNGGSPDSVFEREESLNAILKRVGRQFSELIDQDRAAAYKFLRREIALNMKQFVQADEVGNLRDWLTALMKVEEALGGGDEAADEFPLDKIAKMLNTTDIR